MKVLHVIDRLNIGGAEKVFVDITRLLAEDGIAVGALLFQAGYPLESQLHPGVRLHVLNRRNKYSIAKLYATHNICKQYDIVHVHMRHCYTYVRLSQLLFGGGYKIVLHDHNGFQFAVPRGLKGVFKPRYYIGVSSDLCKWAVEKLLIPQQHVFVLKNTVIPDGTINYQWDPNRNKALIVSNFRKVKNLEFAVRLFKKIDWGLTMYGNRQGDASYFNAIAAEVNDLPNIEIKEGITKFADLYSQYDFAIHTSTAESGPLVLLDYMAYGIPFLSYKTGEVAEIVGNDLPMCFIDSFNETEWIKRMEDIKNIPGISEKLRTTFNKYFSPKAYIKECLSIYQSVSS